MSNPLRGSNSLGIVYGIWYLEGMSSIGWYGRGCGHLRRILPQVPQALLARLTLANHSASVCLTLILKVEIGIQSYYEDERKSSS